MANDIEGTVEHIGFVGLGAMGGPMARNVLKGGYKVKGFDLDPSVLEFHVAAGGEHAGSLADVADGSDIVITMLPDGPSVERAVLGADGLVHRLRPGATLVDMSTIDPATTRRVAAALAERGVAMIDSPVGKSVDHAIAGTLTLMVGGDRETVQRVRPILQCMGDQLFMCGGIGMGSAMKLTNNYLSSAILVSTMETLVMGSKAGLTLELMTDVMSTTMAWNHHLTATLPAKVLSGDTSPGFMVKLAEKDVRLALSMAAELGVDTPVGQAVHRIVAEAGNAGLADRDVTSALTVLERKADTVLPRSSRGMGS